MRSPSSDIRSAQQPGLWDNQKPAKTDFGNARENVVNPDRMNEIGKYADAQHREQTTDNFQPIKMFWVGIWNLEFGIWNVDFRIHLLLPFYCYVDYDVISFIFKCKIKKIRQFSEI